jgi:hypothetical protein
VPVAGATLVLATDDARPDDDGVELAAQSAAILRVG